MTALALATLSRRRFALTARTPRELVVPLLTPVLFAVVIAPALKQALGGFRNGGGDYETLANRTPRQEEYVAAVPAVAIVPWFFAGSLFPITALPTALEWFAKFLPLTHALALIRYGLLGDHGAGLHDIWGMTNATAMAGLSLGVVGVFAAAFTA